MMMKASNRKTKYLLIITAIVIQILVSGFGFIPVTGIEFNTGDTLSDPIQSNPEIYTNTIDPSREESKVQLQNFVESVVDGTSNVIRGLYAEDVMEYQVIQQPSGRPGYVSQQMNIVTEFSMPKKYNVTGLLAHNYLAGAAFFDLDVGDIIQVVYGDGSIYQYEISDIQEYQALSPKSASSAFVNVDTGSQLTATQLFKQVYTGDHHLTLQTCIQVGSEDSWGRLFIIANPVV
jgi:hypothetical protein